MEDFEKLAGDTWKTAAADGATGNAIVEAAIKEYQDPANADKLLKVQRELDDTKVVLVRVLMCSVLILPCSPVPCSHTVGTAENDSTRLGLGVSSVSCIHVWIRWCWCSVLTPPQPRSVLTTVGS